MLRIDYACKHESVFSDSIYISNGYIYHPPLTGAPYCTCWGESLKNMQLKTRNWIQPENEFNSKTLIAIFNLGDRILTLGNCNRSLRYFATQCVLELKEKATFDLGKTTQVTCNAHYAAWWFYDHAMRQEYSNHTNWRAKWKMTSRTLTPSNTIVEELKNVTNECCLPIFVVYQEF